MSTKSSALVASTPSTENGYTATHLAAEFGITPFNLRVALRATKSKKPGGRWTWGTKSDPALTPIRTAVRSFLDAASKSDAAKPAVTPAPAKPEPPKAAAPAPKPAPRRIVKPEPAKASTKPAATKPATPARSTEPRPGPTPAKK